MSAPRAGLLHEEHLLLGAELMPSDVTDGLVVGSYAREAPVSWAREGALLADLTGSAYLLVSGACAPELAGAALCGRELAVGEAAFEGCLSGDGGLIAAPLALRTGDGEVVVIDPTARGAALSGWLGFLANLQGEGGPAFPGTSVEDAGGMLVSLVLAGEAAEAVLSDYARTEPLPGEGAVASVHLDAIGALVARLPRAGAIAGFVLLVPPASARVLWRSLLSFQEVAPVGTRALRELAREALPWGPELAQDGPRRVSRERLGAWGLLRDGDGYVGARALEA